MRTVVPVGRPQLDERYIYWGGDDGIVRTPKIGGSTTLVVPSNKRFHVGPYRIDDTRVFYLFQSTSDDAVSVLASTPKTGAKFRKSA